MKVLIIDDQRETRLALAKALNNIEIPEGCAVELIALNSELPADGKVPTELVLLPAGMINGRDGRYFVNDEPEAIVAAFAEEGMEIPFDWEHATELKAPYGEAAPAAGWGKQLEVRDGAIVCKVDWTDKGRNTIAGKDYRYISPVLIYEKETFRVRKITSVALTNRPNLRQKALNSKQTHIEEDSMELKELLAKLGLPATASFADALNAISKLNGDLETALQHAKNPSLEKFVPKADFALMETRALNAEQTIADQAKKSLESDVDAAIDKALLAKKIAPASKEYYKAMCMTEGGLDKFNDFVGKTPEIIGEANLDGKQPGAGGTALNAEQQQIADTFGNSAEDIAKYGKD